MNPDNDTDTLLKAHIFNYTNIEDYLRGVGDKMHVVDLGPVTYQEHTVKDEVSFNDNHTVTFRVSNIHMMDPPQSGIFHLSLSLSPPFVGSQIV